MSTVPQTTHESQELLQHALGIQSNVSRSSWGYRNNFCAEIGSDHDQAWLQFVEQGLATRGCTINKGQDVYYHVTAKGCLAAGLSKNKIRELTRNGTVPSSNHTEGGK